MKLLLEILKTYLAEALILIAFVACINNYIGNVEKTLNADGIGYYDYLPSLFIHGDLYRKNVPFAENAAIYNRINLLKDSYLPAGNYKVNKYACGTALLESPFFFYTLFSQSPGQKIADGYEVPFQKAIFYAALFYLFFSLVFLRKILQGYQIPFWLIFFVQLCMALGTGLTHYAHFDAGFSHVYSLFAITAFLFFVQRYFMEFQPKYFLWACGFFGLILLLRQVNGLTLFLLPFLAGSWPRLKTGIQKLFGNIPFLICGILLVIGLFSLQSLLWYLQSGKFFLNSYQNEEGFYFFNPQFSNILFSYKKGLFIYTPILLLVFFAWIKLFLQKKYYLLLSSLGFFVLLTYILSSWWSWFYGCSYGLRAYIDYFAFFFILIALFLKEANTFVKGISIIFSLACIYLNLIQTYQYKEYILHWINMDQHMYWKVFAKTDKKYKGLLWKEQEDLSGRICVKDLSLGSIHCLPNSDSMLLHLNSRSIPEFEKIKWIQIQMESNFEEDQELEFGIFLSDSLTGKVYYEHHIPYIHFSEGPWGKQQMGRCLLKIPPSADTSTQILQIHAKLDQNEYRLKDFRVRLWKEAE